jgi:hypothetical protein
MLRWICVITLAAGCAYAQSAAPDASNASSRPKVTADNDELFPLHRPTGKVGLVRGVVRRFDPVYDQLVVHSFGGGDIRVSFDVATTFLPEGTKRTPDIATGSVVSVDTAIKDGKLFALSIRTDTPTLAELNGQVVQFDPTRSRLTVRDLINPQAVTLRIAPETKVLNEGQTTSAQTLTEGMLVRVWFSAAQRSASEVEILAKPGTSFTFAGKILAVDLRSRALSLSNDTDQSLRELVFGSLDSNSLNLLREGNDVVIQAEFDGQRYNVRSVEALSQHQQENEGSKIEN